MEGSRKAFEVMDAVVERIIVPMVDVTSLWDWAKGRHPRLPVQLSTTAR
jgi:hypothetical protein